MDDISSLDSKEDEDEEIPPIVDGDPDELNE